MNYSPDFENNTQSSDTQSHHQGRIVMLLLTIVLLLVAGCIALFFYLQDKSDTVLKQEEQEEVMTDDTFKQNIEAGGDTLSSGDPAAAVAIFQALLNDAASPSQEGQAKLNLGVARLASNRADGVEMLKEVSITKNYDLVTRASAINTIVAAYDGNPDEQFARDHIFTGPVWALYVADGASVEAALTAASEYSITLFPNPRAHMRLAREKARKLFSEILTPAEKDEAAASVEDHVKIGSTLLEEWTDRYGLQYGGLYYVVAAEAYQRKAMASDVLYFNGYLEDPQVVEDAFQESLNILLDNGGNEGIELFDRYLYADFLVRLSDDRTDSIVKILSPTQGRIAASSNIRNFLYQRITTAPQNLSTDDTTPAQAGNIIRLANISPEFKAELTAIGVSSNYFNTEY